MSKDPALDQEIERNLKLRDAASRIRSIAATSIHRLDAEKTMLVSNARLVVSLRQLQREKVLEANAAVSGLSVSNNFISKNKLNFNKLGKAKLCLSKIRFPLIWRDNSSNNLTLHSTATLSMLCDHNISLTSVSGMHHQMSNVNEVDLTNPSVNSYAAFCMIQVGNQVQETRLLCDIVSGTSDLEFDDVLTFEDVSSDFCCIIELYAYPKSTTKSIFLKRKSNLEPSLSFRNSVFLSSSPVDETKLSPDTLLSSSIMGNTTTSSCFSLVARYVARLVDVCELISVRSLDTANYITLSACCEHHKLSSRHENSSNKSISPSLSSPGFSLPANCSRCFDNSCEIPLFGPVCFQLVAQPYSINKPFHRGLLWIRALNVAPKQEAARLYYCELKNRCIYARIVEPSSTNIQGYSFIVPRPPIKSNKHKENDSSTNVHLRKVKEHWDLILSIDSTSELIDETPVMRTVLLSNSYSDRLQNDSDTIAGLIPMTSNESVVTSAVLDKSDLQKSIIEPLHSSNIEIADVLEPKSPTLSINSHENDSGELLIRTNEPIMSSTSLLMSTKPLTSTDIEPTILLNENFESEKEFTPKLPAEIISNFDNINIERENLLSSNVNIGTVQTTESPLSVDDLEDNKRIEIDVSSPISVVNSKTHDNGICDFIQSSETIALVPLPKNDPNELSDHECDSVLKELNTDPLIMIESDNNIHSVLNSSISADDLGDVDLNNEEIVSTTIDRTTNKTCADFEVNMSNCYVNNSNLNDDVVSDIALNDKATPTDNCITLELPKHNEVEQIESLPLFKNDNLDNVIDSEGIARDLNTFHLATKLLNKTCHRSVPQSITDDSNSLTVYEIGEYTPKELSIGEAKSLESWLFDIQLHFGEQVDWGDKVFSSQFVVPEATSFTKHGSIVRASVYSENVDLPSDEPTHFDPDSFMPITSL